MDIHTTDLLKLCSIARDISSSSLDNWYERFDTAISGGGGVLHNHGEDHD